MRIAPSGFDFAHLTSVPGPGSRMLFFPLILRYTPAEERSCLATTNRAPAVPGSLMKSLSFAFTVVAHRGSRKSVSKDWSPVPVLAYVQGTNRGTAMESTTISSGFLTILWPHTLHPGTGRIKKRVPKELGQAYSKDI